MGKYSNSGLGIGTSGAGQLSTEQQDYEKTLKHLDIVLLKESSKAKALKAVSKLPNNIKNSVKSFFKGGSNKYSNFSVEFVDNKYIAKMVKPGNVPRSRAEYIKEIDKTGKTINVYKDTYDSKGNLIHRKDKK